MQEAVGHVPPLFNEPIIRMLLEEHVPERSRAVPYGPTPQLPDDPDVTHILARNNSWEQVPVAVIQLGEYSAK